MCSILILLQHIDHFAAHLIKLDCMHKMAYNLVHGCYLRWQSQFYAVHTFKMRYCSIILHTCCSSNRFGAYIISLQKWIEITCSLPGYLAPGGGSIPPDIIVTNLKPDLFIVNESTGEVTIFKLTCPWDGNIHTAFFGKCLAQLLINNKKMAQGQKWTVPSLNVFFYCQ